MVKKTKPVPAVRKRATKRVRKAARNGAPVGLLRAADMAKHQQTFSHPWNPNSEITGVRMGQLAGLKCVGVNFARVPAGKESYVPHAHQREEEWVYILYGQGVALIEGKEYEVGPGDFIAHPAPQTPHHLRNTGFEDLVYLMGGQALDVDVVDFPTLKKRMVWTGEDVRAYEADAGKNPFAGAAKKKAAKRK